ncbi:hypothetical protein QTP88_002263 [Uroleucon formosanum]
MALSSAYSATKVFGEVGWSAMNMLKRRGAAIAPCGTPARLATSYVMRSKPGDFFLGKVDMQCSTSAGEKAFGDFSESLMAHEPSGFLRGGKQGLSLSTLFVVFQIEPSWIERDAMCFQNGKQLTVLDNFKFKFKYESKISGYKTWECTNKSCKAKLVFNKEKTLIQEKSVLDHTHEADSTIERQAVRDTDEGKFLNYIFGLPFLEPHEVEDSFVFDLIADMPSNNQIVQFCDYLTETYMQDIFPPSLWASKSEVITNNVCESFHSKLNAYFYHHHPSLYKFIDALQDIQVDTYIKIKSAEEGVIQKRNKATTQKYKFINEQRQMKEDGRISRYEFLKKVCFKNKRQNVN